MVLRCSAIVPGESTYVRGLESHTTFLRQVWNKILQFHTTYNASILNCIGQTQKCAMSIEAFDMICIVLGVDRDAFLLKRDVYRCLVDWYKSCSKWSILNSLMDCPSARDVSQTRILPRSIRQNNFKTSMRRVVQTSIDKFPTIETTMLLYILETCLVVDFKIRPHKII